MLKAFISSRSYLQRAGVAWHGPIKWLDQRFKIMTNSRHVVKTTLYILTLWSRLQLASCKRDLLSLNGLHFKRRTVRTWEILCERVKLCKEKQTCTFLDLSWLRIFQPPVSEKVYMSTTSTVFRQFSQSFVNANSHRFRSMIGLKTTHNCTSLLSQSASKTMWLSRMGLPGRPRSRLQLHAYTLDHDRFF